MKTPQLIIIGVWIMAIVLANYNIGWFGPKISILNAFFLIGLSITTRDLLHEMWDGRGLRWKMFLLIAIGGLISYLTQPSLGRVAAASVTAFAITAAVDAFVYHRTRSINKSNIISSGFDSVLFPVLAFGGFPVWIILGQYLAKVAGGAAWAWILKRKLWGLLLALVGSTTAQGQNLSIYQDESGAYLTTEYFQQGKHEVYAFFDQYLYGSRVQYGEIAYYHRGMTVQAEFGDSDFFPIQEIFLAGYRWKGIEVLFRSDRAIQITYAWFYQLDRLQLNGYIDVWGDGSWQAMTQPQVWYWLTDWFAVGGEIICRWDGSGFSAVPAAGCRVNFKW